MTITSNLPSPPNDDLLAWGSFWIAMGSMIVALVTGCDSDVDPAVYVGLYPRECPNACEDMNPCTEDVCTAKGCVHDPISDGTCTEPGLPSGMCWDGDCVCVDAAGCDDGEACTVDSCNAGACGHEETMCGS